MGGKESDVGRRLSKPRSINCSSSTLLDLWDQTPGSSSPLSSSDVDYFGRKAANSSKPASRSERKSRSRLRTCLTGGHGDQSNIIASKGHAESDSSPSSTSAPKTRKRWSKSTSNLARSSGTVNFSSELLNTASTSQNGEVHEDTIAIAEQIKQRAQNDSLAADKHVPVFHLDDETIESLAPPVRRKSLYTPGLATRNVSDILRKPPSSSEQTSQRKISEADRDYYYNASHPESSPLSRIAALKLLDDGRATPTSLNVPNLGGLKLGTLRVTNGSSDSLPTISRTQSMTSRSVSDSIDQQEYHTASESGFEDIRAQKEPLLQPAEPTTDHTTSTSLEVRDANARPEHKKTSTSLSEGPCASMQALAYITEIQDSLSEAFEKLTSAESTAFKPDDDRTSHYEEQFPIDQFPLEDMKECRYGNITPTNVTLGHQKESADLSQDCLGEDFSAPTCSGCKQSEDSQWTCDSGYHSNDSLHDSHSYHEPLFKDNDPDAAQILDTTSDPRSNAMDVLTPDTRNANRKLHKPRPQSQPLVEAYHSIELHDISGIDIPRVPSAMALKHAERLLSFPVLEHTYPSLDHVSSRKKTPRLRIGTVPVRFPSPFKENGFHQVPADLNATLRSEDELDSSFKEIMPVTETEKPRERRKSILRSFSGEGHAASKSKTEHKKLVKKAEEERRRAVKEEMDRQKRLESEEREAERKARRQEAINKLLRSRNPSRTRSKSAERKVPSWEEGETISDFGTVAESLGGSPYDIATSMHPRRQRVPSSIHPHQLGAAGQRPRSFVGMDDATASAFAQARSRARRQMYENQNALADPVQRRPPLRSAQQPRPQTYYGANEITRKPVGILRSSNMSRPQSWSGDQDVQQPRPKSRVPFNDRGGIPGKLMRVNSDNHDVPPVPSMPRQQLKPRPQSMYITGTDYNVTGYPSRKEEVPKSERRARQDDSQGQSDKHWIAQRQAWSERRRSAGEALIALQRPGYQTCGRGSRTTVRAVDTGS